VYIIIQGWILIYTSGMLYLLLLCLKFVCLIVYC